MALLIMFSSFLKNIDCHISDSISKTDTQFVFNLLKHVIEAAERV